MARKPVHRTPLGRRLAEVREKFMKERDEFAAMLGNVSASALSNYERGDNVPDAMVLAAYHEKFGVSLGWLVFEKGDMFDDPSRAPAPSATVDPWVMGRAYSVIEKVCKDIGRPVSGSQLAEEAATIYSALIGRIVDIRDRPMVEAALSVLADEAKARLIETKPGTGKWSASS